MAQRDDPAWWPPENAFLRRLRDGGAPPVTMWVTLGSANVVELLCAHRPDAVILDREHTTSSLSDVQSLIMAAQLAGVTALVRVPRVDRHEVGRLLDAGADGIVFPKVASAREARDATQSVRYPPTGVRGWAGTHARRTRWGGPHVAEDASGPGAVLSHAFVEASNAAVANIFMIEDLDGANEIETILDEGRPDAVIFGWADFTVHAEFDESVVTQARARVHGACRARGIGVALGTAPADAEQYYGGCFLSAGVEATVFTEAIARRLDTFRAFGRTLVDGEPR